MKPIDENLRNRYFTELAVTLKRDGLETLPLKGGQLPVLLDGLPIRMYPRSTICLIIMKPQRRISRCAADSFRNGSFSQQSSSRKSTAARPMSWITTSINNIHSVPDRIVRSGYTNVMR